MPFSFSIIVESWPTFEAGLLTTVMFCSIAAVLGLVLGTIVAWLWGQPRLVHPKALAHAA